jgi:hypothetical protein
MISFAKPPVIEVSLGKVFDGRTDLLIPHIGTFWSKVREKYPRTAHAPIVLGEGETPVIDTAGNWIPRVWLLSQDESWLAQVQQDRFYLNWRDTGSGHPYVRFPAIKSEFDSVWALLEQTVRELTGKALTPKRFELTYTNVVPSGTSWSTVADLGRVLKDFTWGGAPRKLTAPIAYGGRFVFRLPNDYGSLRVNIDTATRRADSSPALRIELQAAGIGRGDRAWAEWVEVAHEAIVNGFIDLTTEQMHRDHWVLL